MSSAATPIRHIRPAYQVTDRGTIRLYAGDLDVTRSDGSTWSVSGDIELQLVEKTKVWATFAGDEQWLLETFPDEIHQLAVAVPPDASLDPPGLSQVRARQDGARHWLVADPRINHLGAGDIGMARRLLVHLTGSLGSGLHWPDVVTDHGNQDRLSLSLPEWTLELAAVDGEDDSPFSYVIEATAASTVQMTEAVVHALTRRLFNLLSFVRGTTIGLGPTVGLDDAGSVVWAEWQAPRVGSTYSRHRWCWDGLVASALPALLSGVAALSEHEGLERCLERGIALCLAANNGDVELDVRVPLACAGLELMAWSVLQHHGWLTAGNGLNAAARLRLLLRWAGIPAEIPPDFARLSARKAALLSTDAGGPEIVFEVRNKLVHPPRNLRDPEWPHGEEMLEAWQLATWYLELALLKVLGYRGEYVSRLIMTGWEGTTEPVPWA